MAEELDELRNDRIEGHFAPPPSLSVHKSIYELFKHFCKPVKTAGDKGDDNEELMMDGATFAKFCRDCPKLGRRVGRTNVDLIFSKSKPMGVRRLDYEHFLDALLGLAKCIYPDEEPTVAFATLLSQYIFGKNDFVGSPEDEENTHQLVTVYNRSCTHSPTYFSPRPITSGLYEQDRCDPADNTKTVQRVCDELSRV